MGAMGVSNHQPQDCLLNCLFRRRSKKTPKLRVTGLCACNSPVTGELPAQMASNAENVSIWWRYHIIYSNRPQCANTSHIQIWQPWINGYEHKNDPHRSQKNSMPTALCKTAVSLLIMHRKSHSRAQSRRCYVKILKMGYIIAIVVAPENCD